MLWQSVVVHLPDLGDGAGAREEHGVVDLLYLSERAGAPQRRVVAGSAVDAPVPVAGDGLVAGSGVDRDERTGRLEGDQERAASEGVPVDGRVLEQVRRRCGR